MKITLIDQSNNKFEAELIRYFMNVNDKYLIYSKNEKDSSSFITLYLTKIISDNGIKIGLDITDKNEWSLIKKFLEQTITENKEGKPVTINDCDPIEVSDLKVNARKPFKLQEEMVNLFSANQKSFEIVQRLRAERNIAVPIPTETTEYVKEEKEEIETSTDNGEEENANTYENLYNKMLESNKQLLDTNEKLIKENDELLEKLTKIKEIIEKN
jgi:hypothetical protein